MKFTKLLSLCLATAFTVFACKKQVPNTTNLLNDADNIFIKQARIENFSETETAKRAISKSMDSAVLSFAQQMLTEHAKAQSDLQIMGTIVGFTATDTIDAAHAAILSQLETFTGRTFDSTYVHNQVSDHQASISFYADELKKGNQLNVRSYANANLQNIQIDYVTADSIAKAYP